MLIGIQLTHSGRYSVRRPVLAQHHPLLDPRTVVDRATGAVADESTPLISDDELDRLQDRYAAAASLALRIGFDFVDIKQCHGYLLNELLSARTRPGKYGGSFENRTRFIREVVGRIRSENPGALIGTRLNVYDGIPYRPGGEDRTGVPCPFEPPLHSAWGMSPDDPFTPDLAEPIALIGQLRDLGVTLVSVSMGNPYTNPHVLRPFEYAPVDGYETPEHPMIGVDRHFRLAEAVQAAFPDLAIVGSGYSWLQAYLFQAGAANVADGRIGFVGVGRASLAAARLRPARPARRGPRPEADLPDLQLLHRADAGQAQRTGPVRHRLPPLRQGRVRPDLGRGEEGPGQAPALILAG